MAQTDSRPGRDPERQQDTPDEQRRKANRPPVQPDIMKPDPAGLEDLNVTRPAPIDVERRDNRS